MLTNKIYFNKFSEVKDYLKVKQRIWVIDIKGRSFGGIIKEIQESDYLINVSDREGFWISEKNIVVIALIEFAP